MFVLLQKAVEDGLHPVYTLVQKGPVSQFQYSRGKLEYPGEEPCSTLSCWVAKGQSHGKAGICIKLVRKPGTQTI